MSNKNRLIVLTLAAAIAAAVAIGSYLSSGAAASARSRAHAAGTQTIDAKTDPAAAGKALSDFLPGHCKLYVRRLRAHCQVRRPPGPRRRPCTTAERRMRRTG